MNKILRVASSAGICVDVGVAGSDVLVAVGCGEGVSAVGTVVLVVTGVSLGCRWIVFVGVGAVHALMIRIKMSEAKKFFITKAFS